MNYWTRFFVQEHANNFDKFPMEVIYQIAHENLSLLEKLTYITSAFFISLFLFYIIYFKWGKPILAKRILIIYLMVLMGVGWPVTLYYAFLKNITPAILLLGFFTLLVINVYLVLIYWIDPFIPREPWKRAEKIWGGIAVLMTAVNLVLITCAGTAQGAIMVQAWSAKYLADMVDMESLSGNLENNISQESSEKSSNSVFIPCPNEENTERIVPLPKAANWLFWRTGIIDPSVKKLLADFQLTTSQEKTLELQRDVAAAVTGRKGAGDVYDINELVKKVGLNPGNTMAGLYKYQYISQGKLHDIYFACAEKKGLLEGTVNFNQEKSWYEKIQIARGGHIIVPHKQGCLALTPKADGGLKVLAGPLDVLTQLKGGVMEKVDSFMPESQSPLSTPNSQSVGLQIFRDSFKK